MISISKNAYFSWPFSKTYVITRCLKIIDYVEFSRQKWVQIP